MNTIPLLFAHRFAKTEAMIRIANDYTCSSQMGHCSSTQREHLILVQSQGSNQPVTLFGTNFNRNCKPPHNWHHAQCSAAFLLHQELKAQPKHHRLKQELSVLATPTTDAWDQCPSKLQETRIQLLCFKTNIRRNLI